MEITIRISNPFRRYKCWFKHDWINYQHNIMSDEYPKKAFVIAFKVCKRCAKSKLIHLLE